MRPARCLTIFLFLLATLGGSPVHAADWRVVIKGKQEHLDMDLSRLRRLGGGSIQAWSRLVLAKPVNDPAGGVYDTLEALNRYDCASGRFATLKRLYLQGDTLLRVEPVLAPKDLPASAGDSDGALLAAVCKTVGASVATRPAAPAAATAAKFGVMHAEMVSDAGSTGPARTLTVADGAPVSTDAKPVDKAASKGTAKITGQDVDKAGAAKGEAPRRLLELPGIDKSRVEHPVDTSNPAAAAAAAKEKDSQPRTERSERRALERAFATSGPRRMLSRKKAAEADTAKEPPRLPVHWSYEGEGGPANWARLRPDYATCDSGKRQSPIDIRDTIRVDQEPLRFDYKPTRFSIVNNGHTIQIGVGEGNTVSVMGRTYELKQFHFHKPSEEKINGRGTDMVIHLVHQDDEGHLAVVAVLLEKGTDNPLIQTLWNNLPLEENQPLTPAPAIDLTRLLPQERGYYSYMGSLTTPPCTEEVLWLVFKQPMQLSADQVSIFSRLYPRNARPVQPANDRLIKESR